MSALCILPCASCGPSHPSHEPRTWGWCGDALQRRGVGHQQHPEGSRILEEEQSHQTLQD